MGPGPRRTASLVGLGLLAFVLGAAALHAWAWDFVSDDTFIVLRYARNLLDGHGLVFNLGERVEAYASLPFVLLTAGLGGLGVDLLVAARALSLLATLACVGLAFGSVRRSTASTFAAVAAGSLVAASAPVACWGLAGLEGPFFAACVLLAVRSVAGPGGAGWRGGLACGLVACARPEGPAVGAVLLGVSIVGAIAAAGEGRRRAWRSVVAFGACLAALLAFRLAYYGDWLPNTYYAKVGTPSAALMDRGLEYLAEFTRDFGGLPLYVLPFVAALWRRDRPWWAAATAALALLACIVFEGGDGLPMYRFVVPFVPLWGVLLGILIADARARLGSRVAPWLVALGLVAWASSRPAPDSVHYLRYRGQRDFEVPAWRAAGEWLGANARAGATVACVPIGAIAYYSGLPVIDMLGLTDAHIARVAVPTGSGWAGHEKHDGKYVLSRRPTYLLLGNVRVLDQALPLDHPEFVRVAHAAVEAREGDVYGSELVRHYVPRVVNLGGGRFLHFLQRRD